MRSEFGRRIDDRAVSSALGYVLTLTITATLVSGLLIGGGQYVENERRQVTTQELNVLAERLAAGLSDADRLSQANAASVEVRVAVDLPRRAAGSHYTVEITDAPNASGQPYRHLIRLSSADADAEASLLVETHRDVVVEAASSGRLLVVYRDADADPGAELVVTTSEVAG
jgi:hypothetical protein